MKKLPVFAPSEGRGRPRSSDRMALLAILYVTFYRAEWADLPDKMTTPVRTIQRKVKQWRADGDLDVILRRYEQTMTPALRLAWRNALNRLELNEDGTQVRGRVGKPPSWLGIALKLRGLLERERQEELEDRPDRPDRPDLAVNVSSHAMSAFRPQPHRQREGQARKRPFRDVQQARMG